MSDDELKGPEVEAKLDELKQEMLSKLNWLIEQSKENENAKYCLFLINEYFQLLEIDFKLQQDYKKATEYLMVTLDTVKTYQTDLKEAKATINQLEQELLQARK